MNQQTAQAHSSKTMNRKAVTASMVALVTLGALFSTAASAADNLSREEIINARQSHFETIDKNMKQLGKALNTSTPDWVNVRVLAKQSQQVASGLKTAFPQGSEEGSRAKSAVWSKPTQFNRLMAEMDQGFTEMLVAVNNQDSRSAQQGLKQAGATCKSCHRQYRSLW